MSSIEECHPALDSGKPSEEGDIWVEFNQRAKVGVGQQGPPLPGHCWALRWREAVCKAGEGPTLVAHRTWHHTGRGGAGVFRSELQQDWAATLNWALRIWASSPVLLPLVPYPCLRFSAGPLPRHYSGCKNRVWHQSARKTLRKAGAVITYQDT